MNIPPKPIHGDEDKYDYTYILHMDFTDDDIPPTWQLVSRKKKRHILQPVSVEDVNNRPVRRRRRVRGRENPYVKENTIPFKEYVEHHNRNVRQRRGDSMEQGIGIKSYKHNKWIEHVKSFASENKMSYWDALKSPKCKSSYQQAARHNRAT